MHFYSGHPTHFLSGVDTGMTYSAFAVEHGMAEASMNALKCGYVPVSPIPNAAAAIALVDSWMADYNSVHPHSRLRYRSLRHYILSQPVACPV
jgi:putative transposase